MNNLTIIIVNYNSWIFLKDCLASIFLQYKEEAPSVIVVDNNSDDDSPSLIKKEFPSVEVIANNKNLGYAKAVNLGIKICKTDFVLVLNPDIIIKDADSIKKMLGYMAENKQIGILGGQLLNVDGSLQYSCRQFYNLRIILFKRTFLGKIFRTSKLVDDFLMADWDHQTVREVDWLLGACMLVRKVAWEDVGLMDERFFLYFEDVDWCYRMKKKNWQVIYYPFAKFIHHHPQESSKKILPALYHIQSSLLFFTKHGFRF